MIYTQRWNHDRNEIAAFGNVDALAQSCSDRTLKIWTGMDAHRISQIIGCLVFLYIGGLLYVAGHLQKKHNDVWTDLGEPSLLNWSILSSLKLFRFVFLSGAHGTLHDRPLTYEIYSLRSLAISLVGLIIWWKLHFF